jgi:glycosyltransferase involved in cell wall biosynthesis
MKRKIVNLTSAHPRFDIRIFRKMRSSLPERVFDVSLVVADGEGGAIARGVRIVDGGASGGRWTRMLKALGREYRKAIQPDTEIYHLQDPELLPIGLRPKKRGKRVIFDSHVDVASQILHKPNLNKFVLWLIVFLDSILESSVAKRLDGIIARTPFIRDNFLAINPHTADIKNYQIIGELAGEFAGGVGTPVVSYIGGITRVRGVIGVIKSCKLVKSSVRLDLCSEFGEADTEQEARANPGWEYVNALRQVERCQIKDVLSRLIAGLVTFHALPNHVNAQPNKMFEYMIAGVPVIASDFLCGET